MFYPLIPGFVAILMGIPVVAPSPAIPIRPEMAKPSVIQEAAPVTRKAAPVILRKAAPVVRKTAPVIVVEAPSRLTFERLRRESSRAPEMGTVGRFIELSTECPPLFE